MVILLRRPRRANLLDVLIASGQMGLAPLRHLPHLFARAWRRQCWVVREQGNEQIVGLFVLIPGGSGVHIPFLWARSERDANFELALRIYEVAAARAYAGLSRGMSDFSLIRGAQVSWVTAPVSPTLALHLLQEGWDYESQGERIVMIRRFGG